jgi:hypothetical protein
MTLVAVGLQQLNYRYIVAYIEKTNVESCNPGGFQLFYKFAFLMDSRAPLLPTQVTCCWANDTIDTAVHSARTSFIYLINNLPYQKLIKMKVVVLKTLKNICDVSFMLNVVFII